MILTLGAGLTIVLILFYVDGVIENPNIDYGRAKVMALLSLWSAGIALVLTKARTLSSKILIITTIATALTLIQSHWWTQIFYVTPLGLLDWIKVFVVVITFLVALFFANRKLI